jgi:hypothetical protein
VNFPSRPKFAYSLNELRDLRIAMRESRRSGCFSFYPRPHLRLLKIWFCELPFRRLWFAWCGLVSMIKGSSFKDSADNAWQTKPNPFGDRVSKRSACRHLRAVRVKLQVPVRLRSAQALRYATRIPCPGNPG